ncbi:transcription factor mef2A isoform X2 [Chrysoperla carnea]|uniref:transcription factor mef2A isoform X2 n=1 Tax=Chrysoperla carnea TaxID=189513 RepID=UPI001D09926E|nr:transcription factor mef2A isoform X2 [Chrysoperla carnea]
MHGYPVMQVVQYHVQPTPPHPAFQRFHHPPPPLTTTTPSSSAVIPPPGLHHHHTTCTHHHGGSSSHHHHNGIKKYVFWCCACGGLSTIIGALFLAVYFMLRSYTSTLTYFETIPTFVPATMLMLTGLCVMSLARRRNRFSYLIKVSGICCLVCALTCVLVTITTTVIHMNRLQTLRECVYTQKTRTCTCYSVLLEAHAETDEGTRFVFDSTPDCEVIHGALYSCLRAMFGLSVSGILVCIFSCMLVYQLLSHERKKMYWEQLELRCRSLYQHQTNSGVNSGSVRGPPVSLSTGSGFCSCCEECRYTPIPANPHLYPWDTHALDRFWTPGRIGNFYSPNPGEEIGPNTNVPGLQSNTVVEGNGSIRARNNNSGWNWRRLPWSRGGGACPDSTRASGVNFNYPTTISSPDSQYGFSSVPGGLASGPVSSSIPGSGVESITATTGSGGYTVLADRQPPGAYLWGPPPPYSNPDSPARRGIITSASPATRYHHSHHLHHAHAHCQLNEDQNTQLTECQHQQQRPRSRPGPISKDNYENTTESEHGHNGHHLQSESAENTDNSSSGISNTLPVRKTKKRMDISSVKSVNQQNFRTNIQNIFQTQQNFDESSEQHSDEHNYQEPNQINKDTNSPSSAQKCRFLPRLQGVENPAFQTQETTAQPSKPQEPTESEVYFADVSSCCNISVRNDGHDSSLYDEALNQKMNQNFSAPGGVPPNGDDEDYLAHRMGKRQMSTRSRLPFPLPNSDEHCKELSSDQCLQQLLPKDLSQNSLSNCSNVQTPLTDTTDDALTPSVSSQKLPQTPTECHHLHPGMMKFSTSNENLDDQFLAPDAQYEVIAQTTSASSNLTTTISGLNNFTTQNCFGNHFSPKNNNVPPKSINCTNSKSSSTSPRKSIGSNISTLIQNLGGNPVGLLYGEVNSVEDDDEIQAQLGGNHSDVTMDSGWQSGSDRPDCIRGNSGTANNNDSSEETTPRSVNV